MALNLDLSSSDAKISRAGEHLKTLQSEIREALDQRKPYTFAIEADENSGRVVVYVVSSDFSEPKLGIVLGDFVHNLRCSLDYIVTALVDKRGIALNGGHQFPIFPNQTSYEAKVGTATFAKPKGPIEGIRYGLQEIWDLQPFHTKPQPEHNPLFLLNYFSNADKHRVISGYYPLLGPVIGELNVREGIIEEINSPLPQEWRPNDKIEVFRVRYKLPLPGGLRLNGNVSVEIRFSTPAFGKRAKGFAVPFELLETTSKHVAMVVDGFKAL